MARKFLRLSNVLFFAACMMLLASPAFAINSVGDTAVQIGKEVSQVPKLIAMAAYVIGTLFAVRALFGLKGFLENPDENPITKVISFAAISAMLIALPFVIDLVIYTISGGKPQTKFSSSSDSFSENGS